MRPLRPTSSSDHDLHPETMTLTAEAPATLPFTTLCPLTGNSPGEYSKSLRWSCELYEGHDGDCVPREFDRRCYVNYRLAALKRWRIPEEIHLNAEMLRHVVNIATSEASDSDGLDADVMWIRINRYIAFANFLRLVCP